MADSNTETCPMYGEMAIIGDRSGQAPKPNLLLALVGTDSQVCRGGSLSEENYAGFALGAAADGSENRARVSMHLEPSDALDVVEGVGLMAKEALLDASSGVPGDASVHHLEVHHVVARRGLVALHTVLRTGRRAPEGGDRPSRRIVTALAVPAEQRPMRIPVDVATRAVEGRRCAG